MPFITAIGSPSSSLKVRPVANSQLSQKELITVPKNKRLGVTFPYDDADKSVQAVRLVAPASDLGLNAGEIFYCFHKEWLVNDSAWSLTKPKSGLSKAIASVVPSFKQKYKPDMRAGDFHLIVVDDEALSNSSMDCYDDNGRKLWSRKCLARGQKADWGLYSGDTPTGLYKLGQLWTASPDDVGTVKPYGIHCFDMISIEDGEDKVGRSGICLHGGGSVLGYSACIDEYQKLVPTFGCIRMHNADLREVILPMWDKCDRSGKTVYVSVYQL